MSFWLHRIFFWKLAATFTGVLLVAILILLCLIFFVVLLIWRKAVSDRPSIDLISGHEAIVELSRLQQASGVKLFAISGTLLGIHRDGDLVVHDDDLDFGIFADDPKAADFFRMMQSSQLFRLNKQFRLGWLGRLMNPWIPPLRNDALLSKFTFIRNGMPSVHVDIFNHFMVASGVVSHGSTRSQWLNSDFELIAIEYKGIQLLVPADRARYLKENYGAWEVPVKSFQSYLDCPNYCPILTVDAVALLAWKLVKQQLHGDPVHRSALWARAGRFISLCLRPRPAVAIPTAFSET